MAAPNSGARAAAVNVGMKYGALGAGERAFLSVLLLAGAGPPCSESALTACGVSCAFRPRPREVSLPPRPRCSLYPGGG